jgi:hypothetical protein
MSDTLQCGKGWRCDRDGGHNAFHVGGVGTKGRTRVGMSIQKVGNLLSNVKLIA